MTHISKHPLPAKIMERIVKTFMDSITSPHIIDRRGVLQTLLTPTEKIMLAKRLTVIAMLERDRGYEEIETRLNVSRSTILRLHKKYDADFFKPIQRVFKKQVGWGAFFTTLELLLTGPLPSRAGPSSRRRLGDIKTRRKLLLPGD
ncbi:MAG TPA: Trp family transcriptional regulator [Candidatus Paceibacterota bacterium]